MRRPRAMVLDEVWRRLDGVEPLSGPHGGPLRRTVKLILDPLVIRPVQHPQCAGSMLTADGAVLLATRIHAAADVLRATAAWFTLLKQTRRGLRITEGNAQDLYFQRCFELATGNGMPDPIRDRTTAETTLREIHGLSAGRTTQALKEYLSDPARGDELTDLIRTAWRRRPVTPVPDHSELLAALLETCAATRFEDPDPDPAVDFDAVVAASVGTHTGIRLWLDENGRTAKELGLTLHPLPLPPRLGTSASTATLGLPLDRTIHERVFTVLQASSERADLPPIPELVDAEIARACAPWALLDESLRVAAAAGAALAVRLRPLGAPLPPGDNPHTEHTASSAARVSLPGTAAGLLGRVDGPSGTATGLLRIAAATGTTAATTGAVVGFTGAVATTPNGHTVPATDAAADPPGDRPRSTSTITALTCATADLVGAARGVDDADPVQSTGSSAGSTGTVSNSNGRAGDPTGARGAQAESGDGRGHDVAGTLRPSRDTAAARTDRDAEDADLVESTGDFTGSTGAVSNSNGRAGESIVTGGTGNGVASNGAGGVTDGLGAGATVGGGVAARVINGRWQREAYVLQARRMVVRGDAVEGPLGVIAADLRVPWRPYLRRLWARLHGRDVREFPVYAADELWDLLDGVARSVILDHRMRVKRALAVSAVGEPGDRESRAG